jgi:hypothetical protein
MPLEFRGIEPEEFEAHDQDDWCGFRFDPHEGDDLFRSILSLERTQDP